jgi:membrane protein YdbS with pleckstrin-like domain
MIPGEPANRLPVAAKAYWRASFGLMALAPVVVAFGALGLYGLVVLAAAIVLVAVVPELRWRRWRYEIRDEEIDLQHGAFTIRRTLVPMRRVQHVDTETGVVQGMFELATVKFHTAAGATSIPALGRGEAERIRRRVADLARSLDDV